MAGLPRVTLFAGLAGTGPRGALREASSGVTLLALAVPLNIGYAQIAGLPPTAGLYALIVPTVVFALLTTSRQLVAAPDASAAALVASSLAPLAMAGTEHYLALAAAQALVGGVIFALCWAFKLGFLANFLSVAVLVGFVGGLAADILLSQLAKMLGISLEQDDFFPRVFELVSRVPETELWSLSIAVLAGAIILVGRRFAPRFPWALVALVVTTLVSVGAHLADKGVAVLGRVDGGFPPLQWPDVQPSDWLAVAPSALALSLVALAEGLLTARRYAEKNGYRVDANQELLAFAGANLAAGLSAAFTVGSSASRTAAVDQARARSQWGAIVAAVLALALLLWGTALLTDIPSPALGAIVALAVVPILGVREMRELWRARRSEFLVAAVCFVAVLTIGPVKGVIVAFLLSVIDVVRRAANPPVGMLGSHEERTRLVSLASPGVQVPVGVVVLRFSAPLFFANASVFSEQVRDVVRADDAIRHFVLDAEGITDIDVTGSNALSETLDWLAERDVDVTLTRVRADLVALLAHYGLASRVRILDSNDDALRACAVPGDVTG